MRGWQKIKKKICRLINSHKHYLFFCKLLRGWQKRRLWGDDRPGGERLLILTSSDNTQYTIYNMYIHIQFTTIQYKTISQPHLTSPSSAYVAHPDAESVWHRPFCAQMYMYCIWGPDVYEALTKVENAGTKSFIVKRGNLAIISWQKGKKVVEIPQLLFDCGKTGKKSVFDQFLLFLPNFSINCPLCKEVSMKSGKSSVNLHRRAFESSRWATIFNIVARKMRCEARTGEPAKDVNWSKKIQLN